MPVIVRLAGGVSVTVTVPLDGSLLTFETTSEYVPAPPWTKLPVWLFAIARSGKLWAGVMLVTSLASSFAVFVSPPPATDALFVTTRARRRRRRRRTVMSG
jgi:hypothetical protein